MDVNVDIDYLKDCLLLTPSERFIRCIELTEFLAKNNPYYSIQLENDHPKVFELK